MKCQEAIRVMPDFLEGQLNDQQAKAFREHISHCPECARELSGQEAVWQTMSAWDAPEPDPGFVSRFWTRVAQRKTWWEKVRDHLAPAFQDRRLIPVLASACVVVLVGIVTLRLSVQTLPMEIALTEMDADEIELLDNMDLVENLEVIEDLEFLEDLELIIHMDV